MPNQFQTSELFARRGFALNSLLSPRLSDYLSLPFGLFKPKSHKIDNFICEV